jgi:uncharacterized protein YjbJ (UPF0337 family)
MTTQSILRAKFAERKAFAIAAIEALTYADDTDEVTADLIAVVRAVAGLMPDDESDGLVEGAADEMQSDMRKRIADAREDADYALERARDARTTVLDYTR